MEPLLQEEFSSLWRTSRSFGYLTGRESVTELSVSALQCSLILFGVSASNTLPVASSLVLYSSWHLEFRWWGQIESFFSSHQVNSVWNSLQEDIMHFWKYQDSWEKFQPWNSRVGNHIRFGFMSNDMLKILVKIQEMLIEWKTYFWKFIYF